MAFAGCGRAIMVQLPDVHTPVNISNIFKAVSHRIRAPRCSRKVATPHTYRCTCARLLRGWKAMRTAVCAVHANNSLLSFISADEEINNVSRGIPRRKYSAGESIERRPEVARGYLNRNTTKRGSRFHDSPRKRFRVPWWTRTQLYEFSPDYLAQHAPFLFASHHPPIGRELYIFPHPAFIHELCVLLCDLQCFARDSTIFTVRISSRLPVAARHELCVDRFHRNM